MREDGLAAPVLYSPAFALRLLLPLGTPNQSPASSDSAPALGQFHSLPGAKDAGIGLIRVAERHRPIR